MLRTTLLSLILFVSLSFSSSSIIRKSLSRRQSDPQYCHAIEGFECKCSHYRVTCTNDRDLPSSINILQNEKQKYQSVELVITAQRDITVNENTFEPVKELYKPDGDNLEFRVKFEKFTALQLSSPGIFNKVFPDNLPANARKHIALEIYNPEVRPNDNVNLFQNLNADSLELYALYPFHGTFQQLFNGANIKYLRLSGGDIRSDLSQPFSGNIGRLELAKQASALSVQNFPVYPAHELIINAFFVTDFNNTHPPNYANLGELRVHSPERIPANAFRQFPNLHTLSISTEKDIDPQALSGLQNLEKLTIKDTKPSVELLNSVPSVKEFETNIEKLDENTQCQLIEKLANGQVSIQTIPNGRECTCVSAYLDTAAGRTVCDAQSCDQSSCAALKNNYDASSRTFTAPPTITRSDGSNALRQHEARVYTAPFQVSNQDQEKLQQAVPPPSPQQPGEGDPRRPDQSAGSDPNQPYNPSDNHPARHSSSSNNDHHLVNTNEGGNDQSHSHSDNRNQQPSDDYQTNVETKPKDETVANDPFDYDAKPEPAKPQTNDGNADYDQVPPKEKETDDTNTPHPISNDLQGGQDHGEGHHHHHGEPTTTAEGGENRPEGGENLPEGGENRPEGGDNVNTAEEEGVQGVPPNAPDSGVEGAGVNGTETAKPQRKGMNWLPIIIVAAGVLLLIVAVVIGLIVRKKKASANNNKGYGPTATNDPGVPATTART